MNQIVITLAQLFGEIYFNKICNFQQKEMVKSNPHSVPYHPLYSDLQQLLDLLNYCYIRILSLFRMFNKCQINCL